MVRVLDRKVLREIRSSWGLLTAITSIIAVRRDPSRVAHAGSLREHESADEDAE